MNSGNLVVERVISIGVGQIALQVREPNSLPLVFIYRAALSIYWNPEESRLEDRYQGETDRVASFKRIGRALREEYGLSLQATKGLEWEGLNEEDKIAIMESWNV
jgi:hypothetical protein